MQNNIYIIMSALLVTGCSTPLPVIQTVTQRVEIPIAVPCKAEVPKRPDYNFDKLTEENNIFEKAKATLADRSLASAYEIELLAALNSCIK